MSTSTDQGCRPALVFDIGGTSIRAGVVNRASGELVAIDRAATPNFLTAQDLGAEELLSEVLDEVVRLGSKLLGTEAPSMAIAGYPGPVTASGVALRSPTILGPNLDRVFDVREQLSTRWPGCNILVLNDLSCAGYAYVARGHSDFCVTTVGSGIGCKVFLDGKPITGPNGRGGEIGHLQVSPGPGTRLSGERDELGNIASGRGTIGYCRRLAEELAGSASDSRWVRTFLREEPAEAGHLLAEAFHSGDEFAARTIEVTCYPLAAAISTMHLAIGLESFFMVGGFAKALGADYLRTLIRIADEMTWDLGQDWSKMISIGETDVEEALLGAAYLACQNKAHNFGHATREVT